MIPRRIHYCSFGGTPPNALHARCLASWARHLPGYSVKEWNESNSPLDVPYCRAAVAARKWSRLSNYVRLHAIHTEGGVYLDTDMELVRGLDPLLGERCFLAFQHEGRDEDWVNNAVLGAEAGHPFLASCLASTVEAFERDGVFLRSPTVTTAVLEDMGLREYGWQRIGGVTLLPSDSFYPFPWYGSFTPACVTERTYGIHHWESSWHVGPVARWIQILRRIRHATMARLTRRRPRHRDRRQPEGRPRLPGAESLPNLLR